ncbi:MAG: hypothetical protein COT92_02100 [Candidatus Doudnabacteria bacterium CG10_big_fil_rev_8_21_14_0_10_42_18]|uniref:Transport permease protein n=1 Tax=Candidatus Doudnabacteria bacterium CG10_big_fil_rev_8_21_14_0_10_42_18 TaxID=1974552 RepID=A0A2H0VAX7_9BACT|nr:MAG: hypothetical protein COT92_02100 [Candidatus Doudnabacteria bacterium CG10_big_fil_rev_8_21_14_0_10_42_18]
MNLNKLTETPMLSIKELFKSNFKIIYRDKSGFFWTVFMPAGIYIALSLLPINSAIDTNLKYSNYVLPGIIAMTIMQGGIYGLAYWMTDLKARGVIKRFLVTPIKMSELIFSLLASRVIVMIGQVVIITLLGVLFFRTNFAGNYISTLILTLLGGSIFLLVGLLISNYSTSYQSAAPLTSAIGLPLTFLGNIFYPIEALPNALEKIARFLPITYLADGLRTSYLYAFDIRTILPSIVGLIIWFVILLLVTIKVFRLKE